MIGDWEIRRYNAIVQASLKYKDIEASILVRNFYSCAYALIDYHSDEAEYDLEHTKIEERDQFLNLYHGNRNDYYNEHGWCCDEYAYCDSNHIVYIIEDFSLFFSMLDAAGIKVKSIICFHTRYTIKEFFDRLERQRQLNIKEQAGIVNEITEWAWGNMSKVFGSFVGDLYRLIVLLQRIELKKYSAMCNGTLRVAEYNEELAKAQMATRKVMRYSPYLAEFADAYSLTKSVIASAMTSFNSQIVNDFKYKVAAYGTEGRFAKETLGYLASTAHLSQYWLNDHKDLEKSLSDIKDKAHSEGYWQGVREGYGDGECVSKKQMTALRKEKELLTTANKSLGQSLMMAMVIAFPKVFRGPYLAKEAFYNFFPKEVTDEFLSRPDVIEQIGKNKYLYEKKLI